MAILITGAAGFIGSHLSEKLADNGYTVIGVDNFDPFYSKTIKSKNLIDLNHHDNFYFFELDIRSEDFSLAVSNNDIDTIVHLAARAGVRPSLSYPQSYVHHDIEGTVNLLQIAQRYDIPNIIFGSSSSVYGDESNVPYSEDDIINKPISPYAASKLSCELFNYVFHSQYGINIYNLRFFTVYGPRQRPEMAISKFISLIDNDKPITMYGNGTSSRDYTYIDDIIQGIELAIERVNGYNTFNLGNETPVELRELIDLIGHKLDKKPQIIFSPQQPGDVEQTLADISKSKRILGYSPKIDISEGLDKYIHWYKQSILQKII